MANTTPVQEFLEQMQDTSLSLMHLSDEELLAILRTKGEHWQGQQVADLLAGMPEGQGRTDAQRRFAAIMPEPPQLQLGTHDITTMDVSKKPDNIDRGPVETD